MTESDSLSDKIRNTVRKMHQQSGGKQLGYDGPDTVKKIELNPDVDKQAFSDTRNKYEDLLMAINKNHVTDQCLEQADNFDMLLHQLNQLALPTQTPGQTGIKNTIRRLCKRLVHFAISDELSRLQEYLDANTRAQNELVKRLKEFSSNQSELNARIALFGQAMVPVMDEKVKFAFDTLNDIIVENVELLTQRMDVLHQGLDRRQTEVITWLTNTSEQLSNTLEMFDALKQETLRGLTLQHRKLEQMKGPEPGMKPVASPVRDKLLSGYSYYLFEQRERGSEQNIAESQSRYLELFRDHAPVLDIGCGRGEFLELLKEAGIPARGFDINSDMVGVCLEKNLDVDHGDGLEILQQSDKASWGAIFTSQVIEHFENEILSGWFSEAYRAIKPGGVLLLETINTASPFALVQNYFKDPTHQSPKHPDTYRFLMESSGFTDVRVDYISPVPERTKGELAPFPKDLKPGFEEILYSIYEAVQGLREFVYSPMDVAISGRKPMEKAV